MVSGDEVNQSGLSKAAKDAGIFRGHKKNVENARPPWPAKSHDAGRMQDELPQCRVMKERVQSECDLPRISCPTARFRIA